MGLLNTWEEWKNETGMFKNSSSNMEEMAKNSQYGSLDTAGGGTKKSSSPLSPINKGYEGATIDRQNANQVLQQRGLNKKQLMLDPTKAGALIAKGTPTGDMPSDNEEPSTEISGAELSKDLGFMGKLANMAGVDLKKASANWKEKGGFDGLMSNPAFSLGLALMQSSANGKTINQGILDNFVKSAKISSEYKDRIEAKKQAPIQATSQDVAEVKSLLDSMNVSDPSTLEKFFGKVTGKGNVQMKFDMAAEDIANELEKEMARLQKAVKPGQPPLVFDTTRKFKILERMLKSGKFKKKGGTWFTDATLESTTKTPFEAKPMAQGGPIQQGKPYVVGEQGPEIIIPRSDGDVLTNDDSQIYAMLLASNPQLQKVSKARAEKIMRNRFPEYFEG